MSEDVKALVEEWRKARGAMPASQHDYINGLLEVGGRLATALEARSGRDEGLREKIERVFSAYEPNLIGDRRDVLINAILALLPSRGGVHD